MNSLHSCIVIVSLENRKIRFFNSRIRIWIPQSLDASWQGTTVGPRTFTPCSWPGPLANTDQFRRGKIRMLSVQMSLLETFAKQLNLQANTQILCPFTHNSYKSDNHHSRVPECQSSILASSKVAEKFLKTIQQLFLKQRPNFITLCMAQLSLFFVPVSGLFVGGPKLLFILTV